MALSIYGITTRLILAVEINMVHYNDQFRFIGSSCHLVSQSTTFTFTMEGSLVSRIIIASNFC